MRLCSRMPRKSWKNFRSFRESKRDGYFAGISCHLHDWIGWPLADGFPHEMRAADYDDWVTETKTDKGKVAHGINGDILVWNFVTKRRHELSSMGIRVNAETLRTQLEMSNQLQLLKTPYHSGIINNQLPLSIGGGIGQSRTVVHILRKGTFERRSVSVWPKKLKEICEAKNIFVLD